MSQKKLQNNPRNSFSADSSPEIYILLITNQIHVVKIWIWLKKRGDSQKTGCKTYFLTCINENLPVILSSLTKQHNLFYTLKN